MVTGGTGFVGQVLIRQLVAIGKPVRTLLRPSPTSPNLPRGIPVEVAVCSLKDERGLRAALKGVDVVFHLAGSERAGSRADLTGVDVEGSQTLANAANQAGVERFFYLSHLGADRNSAYPVLKAKALAEAAIQQSGVPYTIFRSAALFGAGDQFTTSIAGLVKRSPFVVLSPADGGSRIQPLWVDDLVTCLLLANDDASTARQIIEVGGAEFFTFTQVLECVLRAMRQQRKIISVGPAYLRALALFVEQSNRRFPISLFWLDYLAADRTCALDTLPRKFGLMPARLHQHLDHLEPRIPSRSVKA